MSNPDPLEEMAERYRQQGWEVILHPRPEDLPPFFANSGVELLAVKGGEYRAVHSPQTATAATTPPPISSGREPDPIHMRTLLDEAQRFLRTGALEAALLLGWSVAEAALREAVRQTNTGFIRPPMPRELIREGAQHGILSPPDQANLQYCWNLRTMVSHGLRPDVLPPEMVQSLLDIARRLTATAPSETGEEDASGLKSVRYGYGVRQSGELLSLVSSANRVLAEVLGPSAGLVSAEWDRTDDTRGRAIVTLRLSDFAGAVTGTFAPKSCGLIRPFGSIFIPSGATCSRSATTASFRNWARDRARNASDMAAQGEKIDELFKIAHTLAERVDGLREELRAVRPNVVKVNETAAELSTQIALLKQEVVGLQAWKEQLGVTEIRAEVTVLKEQSKTLRESVEKANQGDQKTDVALLKDQVKKLQDEAERRGNRAWSIVPNLVGAIVSGIIAAIVAYFVAYKK